MNEDVDLKAMRDLAQPGSKWKDHIGVIRIMAQAENHVMVRRPSCLPFALSLKELAKHYTLTEEAKRRKDR